MKISVIIICISILWIMYEIHTAPFMDNDKELKDYESDDDALF
jgi:hypothetical protein